MTTHYLHKSITHKNIRVDYLVDFQKKTVSIVNQDRTPKHYRFTDRGLEFMNGWRNILEAVQVAIQEGEALLKEQEEEEFKHFVSVIDCNPGKPQNVIINPLFVTPFPETNSVQNADESAKL